jgi:hypothetical protein
MKIAIKFGDNDFGNTFKPVLEVLNSAYKYSNVLPFDKEKLCFIINSLSPILYITHQNQYEYNGLEEVVDGSETTNNTEFIKTKTYLKIKPKDILLNEEVDKYLKEVKCDNSETYILDTDLNYEGSEPIYFI